MPCHGFGNVPSERNPRQFGGEVDTSSQTVVKACRESYWPCAELANPFAGQSFQAWVANARLFPNEEPYYSWLKDEASAPPREKVLVRDSANLFPRLTDGPGGVIAWTIGRLAEVFAAESGANVNQIAGTITQWANGPGVAVFAVSHLYDSSEPAGSSVLAVKVAAAPLTMICPVEAVWNVFVEGLSRETNVMLRLACYPLAYGPFVLGGRFLKACRRPVWRTEYDKYFMQGYTSWYGLDYPSGWGTGSR